MSAYETLETYQFYFKKKIVILGGLEITKNEFQKSLSSNCLPIENKQNIGVNISKLDYFFKPKQKFEYLLWNIDCGQRRAFLRTIFYSGADAIIIFISETKIDQIRQYFDELQSKIPEVPLIFCIILEKLSKEDIINSEFINKEFNSIREEHGFKITEITDANEILNQVSSFFIEKTKIKEIENRYFINLILLTSLFGQSGITDECNEYYEPETHTLKIRQIINTDLLIEYLQKLDLQIEFDYLNWIKIKNKSFGTFSIYLKNGNVYYFPKICEKCKDKYCPKFKKAPYFVCIEAGDSTGWTNIKGFDQNELLILAKVLALNEGDEKSLPKSVIKQIKTLNMCDYKRKLK
ncbi:MAG: hypothetical protein ACFE94_06900 [Candidatus Hodarchaeota archaeon]